MLLAKPQERVIRFFAMIQPRHGSVASIRGLRRLLLYHCASITYLKGVDMSIKRMVFSNLKGYKPQWLRNDLLAALVVTAIAIPE